MVRHYFLLKSAALCVKVACIQSETKVNVENQLVQMGKILLLQQVTLS